MFARREVSVRRSCKKVITKTSKNRKVKVRYNGQRGSKGSLLIGPFPASFCSLFSSLKEIYFDVKICQTADLINKL